MAIRQTGALLVLTLALFAAGCGDLLSLHALHTPQDRVFDSAIEGRWESDKQLLEVERDGNLYRVKLQPKSDPAESRDYQVHRLKSPAFVLPMCYGPRLSVT